MKLTQSLALIITGSASFVIPFVAASSGFDIKKVSNVLDGSVYFVALAILQNNSCDFFQQGNGAANISSNDKVALKSVPPKFQVRGLCGSEQLDFYQKKIRASIDSSKWDYYYHKEDGSLQGSCFRSIPNNVTCSSTDLNITVRVNDELVCINRIDINNPVCNFTP